MVLPIRNWASTVLLIGALTNPAHSEILIGAAAPMTGPFAAFGAQMQAGAEMAVSDINTAGGINGEMLKLELVDDSCDPRQAMLAATRLVDLGAVFVVGHFCSGASIQASEIYAAAGVVQISPASNNPAFTDNRPGPGIYRIAPRSDQQGRVAGNFLATQFSDKHIAIINDGSSYGLALAEGVEAAMRDAGKQPDLTQSYSPGGSDYSDLASALRQSGTDLVYVGGDYRDASLIKRQMQDAGLNASLMSGDAVAIDDFWAITGEAGEGTLMTDMADPREEPDASGVVGKFRATGVEPEGYTLHTYAAVQVFAQAMQAAGKADHDAIVKAIDTGTFQTVIGTFGFNAKGDATRPGYAIFKWSEGFRAKIFGVTCTSCQKDSDCGSNYRCGSDKCCTNK